jgi:hypothetical protein
MQSAHARLQDKLDFDLRPQAAGRQNVDVPPSPKSLSTASTPPAKKRKVLPMSPVQNVTYLSGRTKNADGAIQKWRRSLQTGSASFQASRRLEPGIRTGD